MFIDFMGMHFLYAFTHARATIGAFGDAHAQCGERFHVIRVAWGIGVSHGGESTESTVV